MSEQNAPVATNTLSKKEKNKVDVYHASCQCYFRIETLEIIFLSEADARPFDDKMNMLSMLMANLHHARQHYSDAVEAYGKKLPDIALLDIHSHRTAVNSIFCIAMTALSIHHFVILSL